MDYSTRDTNARTFADCLSCYPRRLYLRLSSRAMRAQISDWRTEVYLGLATSSDLRWHVDVEKKEKEYHAPLMLPFSLNNGVSTSIASLAWESLVARDAFENGFCGDIP